MKRHLVGLVVSTLALLALPPAPAHAGAVNRPVTTDTGFQAETNIAVSRRTPGRMVVGWADHRASWPGDVNCAYSSSADDGTTWATNGYLAGITSGIANPYDKCTDPSVGYSFKHDTFHYLGLAVSSGFSKSAIVYANSADGGASWSSPQFVAQSNSPAVKLDKDAMAIDQIPTSPTYGRIYAVWTQSSAASGKVIQVSHLNGTVWSAPVAVSAGYQPASGPMVAVGDTSGTVYVGWCYTGLSSCGGQVYSAMMVTRSTDGGVHWSTPVIAAFFWNVPEQPPGDFRINSFGTLAADPGNGVVHLTYTGWTGSGTGTDILYTRSADGGQHWDPSIVVNTRPGDQFFPWMAASPDGSVIWVCYYDEGWYTGIFDLGLLDVSCSRSVTATGVFEPAVRVTQQSSLPGGFIGDYIGTDVTAGGLYRTVWTDLRDGNTDIYFGKPQLLVSPAGVQPLP